MKTFKHQGVDYFVPNITPKAKTQEEAERLCNKSFEFADSICIKATCEECILSEVNFPVFKRYVEDQDEVSIHKFGDSL